MKVIVIGAGPSGLVTLKTLLEEGFDAECLEANEFIGGTFRTKAYEGGHLVSSKYITSFSDFRAAKDDAEHLTMDAYVEYLEQYCRHFCLKPRISFGTRVERVERVERGPDGPDGPEGPDAPNIRNGAAHRYEVLTSDGTLRRCDAVAVCSGVHNVANIPRVFRERRDDFAGEVLHSSEYKSAKQLAGKRVVVVGSQETGMDIAHFAVTQPDGDFRSVDMVYRRGFLSIPHCIGGLPLDTHITNLFECCYQHPWLEQGSGTPLSGLKWAVSTVFIRLGLLLGTGSSVGFNQWTGAVKHVRRGYNYITKSTAAMPYINVPYKRRSALGRLWRWIDGPLLPGRQIDVHRGDIVGLGTAGAPSRDLHLRLADGSRRVLQADLVVLCTGYRQHFPFLDGAGEDGADAALPNEHCIVDAKDPRLAFIGFVRPNVGAIPPMAEIQAMWWIQRLRGAIPGPRKPYSYETYHLFAAKHQYSVDYGQYVHELARDIGAAPDVLALWQEPRIAVAYGIGQALLPFFRLQGPFRSDKCFDTARTELFACVADRGVAANAVFVATVLFFGGFNLAALAVDCLLARPLSALLGALVG